MAAVTGSASFTTVLAPQRATSASLSPTPIPQASQPTRYPSPSRGSLRDAVLTASVSGEGQGFKLAATSREDMIVGNGFDVRRDVNAPLQAQLDMTGRAEQLWALFGPEDQSLRGELQANVRAAGTIARPDLSGGFSVAKAAYEHGETGVSLRDITASGEFDATSVQITSVSANDGHGGRLTGEGAISWQNQLSGGINLAADNLRALGRDDRMAVISGQGRNRPWRERSLTSPETLRSCRRASRSNSRLPRRSPR